MQTKNALQGKDKLWYAMERTAKHHHRRKRQDTTEQVVRLVTATAARHNDGCAQYCMALCAK